MQLIELNGSGSGTDAFEGSTATRRYIATEDQDIIEALDVQENDVRIFARNETETEFTSTNPAGDEVKYYRSTISVNHIEIGHWEVTVTYTQKRPDQISFQTGGGSEKVQYSLNTIQTYYTGGGGLPDEGPDFKRGINVTKNGVEGVDIVTKKQAIKVTRSWAMDDIDGEYLRDLEELTGSTNDADYTISINGIERSFRPEELLFNGADGQTTNDNRLELTYSFSISRGIYEGVEDSWRTVGDITVKNKPGWAYLWVYAEEKTESGFRVMNPVAVMIEQVYPMLDFEKLRLDE